MAYLLVVLAVLGCGKLEKKLDKVEHKVTKKIDKTLERASGAVGGSKKGQADKSVPGTADPCAARGKDGTYAFQVDFRDETIPVEVYLPKTAGPHRMAVLLHGGNQGANAIKRRTLYDELAAERGFVVAVPEGHELEGRGHKWNTGKWDEVKDRNDSAFLDALAQQARDQLCVKEVLAIGFSSGAQMANRWACEGQNVDATAFSAGALLVGHDTCSQRRVPILSFVGTKDDVFHGSTREDRPDFPSGPESAARWAAQRGCTGEPKTSKVGEAECQSWKACAVRHCNVVGMGHDWPGGREKDAWGFDATPDSWEWFTAL